MRVRRFEKPNAHEIVGSLLLLPPVFSEPSSSSLTKTVPISESVAQGQLHQTRIHRAHRFTEASARDVSFHRAWPKELRMIEGIEGLRAARNGVNRPRPDGCMTA